MAARSFAAATHIDNDQLGLFPILAQVLVRRLRSALTRCGSASGLRVCRSLGNVDQIIKHSGGDDEREVPEERGHVAAPIDHPVDAHWRAMVTLQTAAQIALFRSEQRPPRRRFDRSTLSLRGTPAPGALLSSVAPFYLAVPSISFDSRYLFRARGSRFVNRLLNPDDHAADIERKFDANLRPFQREDRPNPIDERGDLAAANDGHTGLARAVNPATSHGPRILLTVPTRSADEKPMIAPKLAPAMDSG